MKKLILKSVVTAGMCFMLATQVSADGERRGGSAEQPQLRDTVPVTHTVVKGDTLWDISSKFLTNPWMWPEIWHVNAQIENPHLIYPGDVIRLVYIDGQPRLTLDNSGRVHKLTPKARVISVGEAIDTIPLDKINSFLSRSRVVGKKDLELAPYIVAGAHDHLIVGAGDRAYAKGPVEGLFSVYGVVRKGQVFKDPETKEFLGVQALDIGTGEVRSKDGDISTLLISRSTEEIRAGDRLLRQEERALNSAYYPSSPKTDISGVILAVEDGVNQVGKMNVVVLNRGAREGLAVGNVLAVHKRGARIRNRVEGGFIKLPDERAGLLMVFRVFDKVSFGLVLEASLGLTTNDIVTNP